MARYGSTMSKSRRIWVPIPKTATHEEARRLIREATKRSEEPGNRSEIVVQRPSARQAVPAAGRCYADGLGAGYPDPQPTLP